MGDSKYVVLARVFQSTNCLSYRVSNDIVLVYETMFCITSLSYDHRNSKIYLISVLSLHLIEHVNGVDQPASRTHGLGTNAYTYL